MIARQGKVLTLAQRSIYFMAQWHVLLSRCAQHLWTSLGTVVVGVQSVLGVLHISVSHYAPI